jgi:hypothetical protein
MNGTEKIRLDKNTVIAYYAILVYLIISFNHFNWRLFLWK